MSLALSMGFSLCYSKMPVDMDMIETILFSELDRFEISGQMFESDEFEGIYKKFFSVGKKIFSVHEVLPANISRNWSACSDNMKKDLTRHLRQKIQLAADKGVKFLRIDLGLDTIKSGFEVNELNLRTPIIAAVLAEAEKYGIILCHPLRFPKPFPSSREWRFGTMLVSSLLHKNYKIELDVFPGEVSGPGLDNLMKRLFYYPEIIRMRYEPAIDGGLNADQFKQWMNSLKKQGFKGSVIFAPLFDNLNSLQNELHRVNNLIKDYERSENEEAEEES